MRPHSARLVPVLDHRMQHATRALASVLPQPEHRVAPRANASVARKADQRRNAYVSLQRVERSHCRTADSFLSALVVLHIIVLARELDERGDHGFIAKEPEPHYRLMARMLGALLVTRQSEQWRDDRCTVGEHRGEESAILSGCRLQPRHEGEEVRRGLERWNDPEIRYAGLSLRPRAANLGSHLRDLAVRDGERHPQRTWRASVGIPVSADRLKVVSENRALVADEVATVAVHAHSTLDFHPHDAIGSVGDAGGE